MLKTCEKLMEDIIGVVKEPIPFKDYMVIVIKCLKKAIMN